MIHMTDELKRAAAALLGAALAEESGDSGPWLIYADGTVESWPTVQQEEEHEHVPVPGTEAMLVSLCSGCTERIYQDVDGGWQLFVPASTEVHEVLGAHGGYVPDRAYPDKLPPVQDPGPADEAPSKFHVPGSEGQV